MHHRGLHMYIGRPLFPLSVCGEHGRWEGAKPTIGICAESGAILSGKADVACSSGMSWHRGGENVRCEYRGSEATDLGSARRKPVKV